MTPGWIKIMHQRIAPMAHFNSMASAHAIRARVRFGGTIDQGQKTDGLTRRDAR